MLKTLHFKSLFLLLCLVIGGSSSAWGDTWTYTFNKSKKNGGQGFSGTAVSSGETTTINEKSWTFTGDNNCYFGLAASGMTIGSSDNPPKNISLSTNGIGGTISSVKVELKIANGGVATVGVSVGNTTYGTEQSLTTTATEFEFTGNSSGVVSINIKEPSTTKQITCTKITITYSTGQPNTISTIEDQTVDILKTITLTPSSSNSVTDFTFSTTSNDIELSTTSGKSCVITGKNVTTTPAVVTISQAAGNGYLSASTTVNVSVVDNRSEASIELGTPTEMTVNTDQEICISSNSSGGYTFTSSNDNIAMADLSGNNVYIMSGDIAGTATITVTQAETPDYKETTTVFSVTVTDSRTAVSISLDAYEMGINTNKTFNVSSNSDGAITLSMDNAYEEYALIDIAADNKSFNLLGAKAGVVKINIHQASTDTYQVYDGELTITITDNREVPSFSYSVSSLVVEQGESYTIPVLTNDCTDGSVTYTSSNTSVATIDGGILSIVAPGETDITASLTGSPTKQDAIASYHLTVTKAAMVLPYNESFETNLGMGDNFTQTGDGKWSYNNSSEAMYANAGAQTSSESWLISPVIDLRGVKNASLTYSEKKNSYLQKKHIALKVKKAGETEWTDLTITLPTSTSFNNKTIALTEYVGNKIQIAFVYTSYDGESWGQWYIKAINVKAEKEIPSFAISQQTATLHYKGTREISVTTNSDGEISASVEEGKENVTSVAKKPGEDNVFIVSYGTEDGTADVTFSVAESENFLAASAKLKVTMEDGRETPTITLADENMDVTTEKAIDYSTTSDGDVSFTSSDENVVKIENDVLKALALGTATITANITGTDTYKPISATFDVTVTSKEAVAPVGPTGGNGYTLVTDASTLAEGDKIIIVNNDANVAMSTNQGDNNRSATDVTISNETIETISNSVQVITLEGNSEGWYFNVGNSYLYAASSEKNYLRTQTTKDNNAKATIVINATSKVATVTFQGSNTRNIIQYNDNNTSIFSCYGSNQKPVYIYRLNTATKFDITIGKNGWKTLVASQNFAVPEDVTAYKVTSSTESSVHLEEITGVKKNVPVVLKGTANKTYTVSVADEANCDDNSDNLLQISTNTTGNGVYVLATKGDKTGWYKWAGGSLGAGRVYLPATTGASAREFLSLDFDDNTTTGISTMHNSEFIMNNEVYNLNGQRVDNLKKGGLYIMNGKKVVIK